MRRALVVLLLLAPLVASARPPRLTLWITVDGLSSDLFLRHRGQYKSGLAQLLAQGAYFPTARYAFAEPGTAPGHTTLATGAQPWRHGIIGNRIYNRATGAEDPVFADPNHPLLDSPLYTGDASPIALEAEPIGDRLRMSSQERAKVVSIAGKARAAIPFAGRLGQAWWFHEPIGGFSTGMYYQKALPTWVASFNDRKVAESWFAKNWELSLPAKQYLGADDRPFEADIFGLGRVFPHPLNGGLSSPGKESFVALTFTPHLNDVLVQFARAAIVGEKLGADEHPDLLAVSLSATDKVQHLYGPYSWEMQDAMLKLDRSVGELIAAAEKAAGGRSNLLVVLSADHGSAAVPEEWAAAGSTGVRVSPKQLAQSLQSELQAQFGADVKVGMDETDVYLGGRMAGDKGTDSAALRRAAVAWLMRQPSVAFAISRDELFTRQSPEDLLPFLRRGFHPARSGDVLYVVRPFHVATDEATGTNHGTPWSYDTDVPVILLGKGIRAGTYPQIIDPADLAPTVAAVLEIGIPASAEGTVRAEALSGK